MLCCFRGCGADPTRWKVDIVFVHFLPSFPIITGKSLSSSTNRAFRHPLKNRVLKQSDLKVQKFYDNKAIQVNFDRVDKR